MIVPTATKVGPVATGAHRRCARTRHAPNANKDWIRISGLDTIIDPISDVTITADYYLDGLTRTVDDGSNANTYAFDAAGQVTVRSDETGSAGVTGGSKVTTSYAYNDAGLVAHADSGVLDAVTDYSWDDAGRLTKEQAGSHTNDWSWHPDDTVAGVKTTAGGSTKADLQYRYDNNGDITKQTVTGAKAYENTYAYSPARNVVSWQQDTDPAITYGWDRNNNRTSVSAGGTVQASTTYRLDNSINQIDNLTTPDRTYVYNDAGLLASDGCNTNTYDDFDRISTVHASNATGCSPAERTTTYTYDGLDRQRSIAVDKGAVNTPDWTTKSVYDGLSTTIVGQTDAVNKNESKPEVLYQLDPTGRQMAMEQTGAGAGKSFLDTDGHGTVTTQVTTGNDVACIVKYEPFGNPIDVSGSSEVCTSGGSEIGSTGNTIWYRGQPRDASTGNYQLGTRTYNPSTGTFTTPDAYRISDANTDISVGVDPLSANTYTYVNGNPVNMIDPDGHYIACEGNYCPSGQGTPYLPKNKTYAAAYQANKREAKKLSKSPAYVASGLQAAVWTSAFERDRSEIEWIRRQQRYDKTNSVLFGAVRLFTLDERSCKGGIDFGCAAEVGIFALPFLKPLKALKHAGELGSILKRGDDAAKTAPEVASGLERTGTALSRTDPFHRSVSWVVDNPAAKQFTFKGGDGVTRDLYQLPGEVNGKAGVFEWIIDRSGANPVINHQRFIPGGSITGVPNQVVP